MSKAKTGCIAALIVAVPTSILVIGGVGYLLWQKKTTIKWTQTTAKTDTLTKDERIAWEKERKQHENVKCSLVGYIGLRRWAIIESRICDEYEDPDPANWKLAQLSGTVDLIKRTNRSRQELQDAEAKLKEFKDKVEEARKRVAVPALKVAEKLATTKIKDPEIVAIAIVDLYSKPDPVILEWVYDDGKAVKISGNPPPLSTDLGSKADWYLHWLQTRALYGE